MQEILPELDIQFHGRRWGASILDIPGGRRYHPAQWLEETPEALGKIRKLVFERCSVKNQDRTSLSSPLVVYIQRGYDKRLNADEGATRRSIGNEDEVLEIIRKHYQNLYVVQLEQLSFCDQVRSVTQASLIIGQHGSGLWSVLWGSQCKALIELAPFRDHYQVAARIAGAEYYGVETEGRRNSGPNTYRGRVRISTLALEETLKQIELSLDQDTKR